MRMLITGTSGGIGGAVKAAAQSRGWDVVEMNRGGFEAPLPTLDALLFCTGMCPVKPLSALTNELLNETFAVNCGLFVALMRRVMRERLVGPNGLRAIAVSSVSATEGWPGGAAYCASKGALSAVCRALDAELRGRGVSVAAVEPRYVRTRMFAACAGRMGVDPACAEPPEEFAERLMEMIAK